MIRADNLLLPADMQHRCGHAADTCSRCSRLVFLRLESTDFGTSVGSARLLWPAAVAAGEADDAAVQTSFALWIGNSKVCSGLPHFDVAKSKVERVWQARRSDSTSHTTWSDLMEELRS